jgi:hypothetical protein
MLAELACLSLDAGRADDAETQAQQSLALAEQIRDHAGRAFGVGLLATVAAQRGQLESTVDAGGRCVDVRRFERRPPRQRN